MKSPPYRLASTPDVELMWPGSTDDPSLDGDSGRFCVGVSLPAFPLGAARESTDGDLASLESAGAEDCNTNGIGGGANYRAVSEPGTFSVYDMPTELHKEGQREFIAGALVGVAGAFFVAAVQALMLGKSAKECPKVPAQIAFNASPAGSGLPPWPLP